MIVAFHCVFSTYGSWLPNDLRGSWSRCVRSLELHEYGPATKVETRISQAGVEYDRQLQATMRTALKHPPIKFTGKQAGIVGNTIGQAGYRVHALAVMPNHVHVVVGRTERPIRKVIGHLKANATRALREKGHHRGRPVWTKYGWAVFLNNVEAVGRAVEYVEANPVADGLPAQHWPFVEPFVL